MKMMPFAAVVLLGCGGAPGTAAFTTWGEALIEDQIPAEDVEDGYAITYSKFLVNLGEISLAGADGKAVATQKASKIFDLKKKGPVPVETFAGVAAARYEKVGYAIAPATSASVAGNAEAADVTMLKDKGYSIFIEGSVVKGSGAAKTFSWGFTTNTQYNDCEAEGFGKGLTVPAGGTESVQLTIHGDHFWYDDLQSMNAKVRVEAVYGADKSGDNVITLDELAAVDLSTLPATQYGTGGASSVKDLKDFVTALARTIGHYRGEGECSPKVR